MLETFNNAATALYCKAVVAVNTCKAKIKSFFSDEQGISGVVVAVMLVLVGVLAAILLWSSLSGWLGEMWGNITGKSNELLKDG